MNYNNYKEWGLFCCCQVNVLGDTGKVVNSSYFLDSLSKFDSKNLSET